LLSLRVRIWRRDGKPNGRIAGGGIAAAAHRCRFEQRRKGLLKPPLRIALNRQLRYIADTG
jgi:hypothetical protein